MVLYILGTILIWNAQADIAASTEKIEYVSPIAAFAAKNIFATYMIVAGIFVTIIILTPIGKRSVQEQLKSIGLINHAEAEPQLKSKRKDEKNPKISIWEFTSQGIPLKVWKDKYLSTQSFVLNLGESFTDPVSVDQSRVPHILLGGATGSGKSVLLKLLLMQANKKGAHASIADFKGGVDFPPVWHKECRICGRADNVLSMIILDKTDAADLIPEDAQGRFLLHNETMFQTYWFEDTGGM